MNRILKVLFVAAFFSCLAYGQNPVKRDLSCVDAGANDTYVCSIASAPLAYVSGESYCFKANTANTGAATINFNSLGALTIKKPNGGSITADLADNDIRANQWVCGKYDGTNFQMSTQVGNAPSGSGTVNSGTQGQWGYYATASTAVSGAGPGTANQIAVSNGTSGPAFKSVSDLSGTDYVAGGGTAQAQTATLSPALSSLITGAEVKWLPTAANTSGGPTLAVNGLTATAVKKCGTVALVANDLTTTSVAVVVYDGTQFQLINPQAVGCASAPELAGLSSTGVVKRTGAGAFAAAAAGTDYMSPTSTETKTNLTLDAEGTGNAITAPFKTFLPAAGCQGSTAGSFWDLPASTPAVAACVTGTNIQKGVLQFADTSGGFSAQTTLLLPSDFSGAIDARIIWRTSATTGNAKFSLSTICTDVAASTTDDPAFNTASTVTTAAAGTTLWINSSSISGVTATGCSANKLLHLKLFRDGNDGSDTISASLDVIGVELTIRRAM